MLHKMLIFKHGIDFSLVTVGTTEFVQDPGEPVPRPEDPGLCSDVPVSHIPGRAHGCGRCARKVATLLGGLSLERYFYGTVPISSKS